jgi:hypothetical protein
MSNLLGSLRERNEMNYRNRALALEEEHRNKALQLQRDEANWRNQLGHEHNAILQKGTEQYGKFMDWQMGQPNAAALKEQDYQNALAERQANAGYFEDANHVRAVYPKMSEAQAGLLADASNRARQAMTFDFQTAHDAASTLNRQAELEKAIAEEKKNPHPEIPWYSNIAGRGVEKARTSALGPLLLQKGEIDRRVNRIQTDKRLAGLVTFDPDSGKYVPAVPPPQWGGSARGGAQPAGVTPEDQAGGAGQASWATPGANTGTPSAAVTPEDQAGGGVTSTAAPKRKYAPMVYDRAQYWTQQGLPMANALARALQESESVQGAPTANPEDLP